MLHSKHITVAANTTESNLQETRFEVNKGILWRVYLTFPAGCVGLVKFRMSFDGSPILPVEKDAFIKGDNFVFVYPLMIEIDEEPMQILVEAWNEDETYAHTIDLQLLIVDKKFVQPIGAAEGIISSLRSVFVKGV